jgi:hypothetical protein
MKMLSCANMSMGALNIAGVKSCQFNNYSPQTIVPFLCDVGVPYPHKQKGCMQRIIA